MLKLSPPEKKDIHCMNLCDQFPLIINLVGILFPQLAWSCVGIKIKIYLTYLTHPHTYLIYVAVESTEQQMREWINYYRKQNLLKINSCLCMSGYSNIKHLTTVYQLISRPPSLTVIILSISENKEPLKGKMEKCPPRKWSIKTKVF